MTGRHIFNLYRALYSFKNLKTTWHGQKVKIIEVQMCDSSVDAATHSSASIPGSITYIRSKNSLQVHCADESSVEILKLQLEGRKVFTARDFNNGYLKKAATNDRYFEWLDQNWRVDRREILTNKTAMTNVDLIYPEVCFYSIFKFAMKIYIRSLSVYSTTSILVKWLFN